MRPPPPTSQICPLCFTTTQFIFNLLPHQPASASNCCSDAPFSTGSRSRAGSGPVPDQELGLSCFHSQRSSSRPEKKWFQGGTGSLPYQEEKKMLATVAGGGGVTKTNQSQLHRADAAIFKIKSDFGQRHIRSTLLLQNKQSEAVANVS